MDNPDLGKIAFQFGTRPLLTQESPIPNLWKDMLRNVNPGDVLLHKFSPTGFYSSAVKTPFLIDLANRSKRQVQVYKKNRSSDLVQLGDTGKARSMWVKSDDYAKVSEWIANGNSEALKTPDGTVVFVSKGNARHNQKRSAGMYGLFKSLPVLKLERSR